MKALIKRVVCLTVGGVLVAGLAINANAVPITVDVVLADDPSITTADASVDMVASGNTLTITLCNLLTGGPTGAGGLLSGLAFDMNGSTDITGGTVMVAAGSTIVSSLGTSATDVSGEYGYANGNTGHFNDFGTATDTQISAMVADGGTMFSSASLEPPSGLDGPEFGLLGPGGDPGGLTAIQNCIVITLTLNKTVNGGFLSGIEGGIVAVTYGSPTYRPPSLADTGSTMGLLGLAMVMVEVLRRRFKAA